MFRNCLTRQINELESLQAMYCGPNELTVWNEKELENLKLMVQGRMRIREDDLPQVAFQLQLPLDPPYVSDLVFRDLRAASTTFVETKIGQECILDLVQFAKDWVYDHTTPPSSPASSSSLSTSPVAKPAPVIVAKPIPVIVAPTPVVVPTPPVQQVSGIYTLPTPPPAAPSSVAAPVATAAAPKKPAPVSARKVKAAPKGKNTPAAPKEQEFRRIMIWFTTIAPDRAKTIAEWAKQLGLTGISRLGSPALVVVEGNKEDVDEYVSSLRTFRWKKMEIVWEDKMKATNTNACRRFTNFQECMLALPELQLVFKKAGLEDMYKEGLKIRG